MNYMVIHEELKAGGWRTIVPDIPRCGAAGVKFETRKRSAERNIRKHVASLIKADKGLPKDTTKTVHLKRTVRRCFVHFVQINPLIQPKLAGAN
jgi:hypothetical protein